MSTSSFKKYHSSVRDTLGRIRTISLFRETCPKDMIEEYPPLYSLAELRILYMSYDHIPGYEYEFAMDVFGDWEVWARLTDESQLRKKHFQVWREEKEIQLRAAAMREVINHSRGSSPSGLQAAKYLTERGYESKRGRPNKLEVEREKRVQAGVRSDIEKDLDRLGLSVIEGGKG